MGDLVKFEIVRLPRRLIVGKALRYSDDALNGGDNRLPAFWNRCCAEDIFAPLEAQAEYLYDGSRAGVFTDWYLGDGDFTYIAGVLMRPDATIPEGYAARELEDTEAAYCQVRCKNLNETRAVPFDSTARAIGDAGRGCDHMKWCVDLYHPARSVIPDKDGYVILDCYIPLDQ